MRHLLLTFAMVVGLAACGGTENGTDIEQLCAALQADECQRSGDCWLACKTAVPECACIPRG